MHFSIVSVNSVVFPKESNYDYSFIINQLAKEFEQHFNCLGEKLKYSYFFSVPIEKEVARINKSREKIYHKKFYENLKKRFANLYKCANRQWVTLFCCGEQVFIRINTEMAGRN